MKLRGFTEGHDIRVISTTPKIFMRTAHGSYQGSVVRRSSEYDYEMLIGPINN